MGIKPRDQQARQLVQQGTGTNQDAAQLGRRELLAYASVLAPGFVAAEGLAGSSASAVPKRAASRLRARKRYDMKKSINFWAFPYPDRMSLKQCLELAKDAGFEGVELNFDLKGELSAESTAKQLRSIGELVRRCGLSVSGLCSFLFWPYPLTSNDAAKRRRGLELAHKMIDACRLLGTKNLLIVPGAVYIPWDPEPTPVPNDVCWQRAAAAIQDLIPHAEKAGVYLNIENILVNGFLCSPQELAQFVDSFKHPHVRVHFDTGNVMEYQFPEHWIPVLGKRIQNVHLKEYNQRVHEFNLDTFRPLLDGTTNWPAVIEAFDAVGYRGYLTFEYFRPFQHWPEVLVYQTSHALDLMLGRKVGRES